jgi:polyphenol oxidase
VSIEPFYRESESYYSIKNWTEEFPCLTAGFTTRNGGESNGCFDSLNMGLHVGDKQANVIKNRAGIADLLQLPLDNWVAAEQTHGSRIHKATPSDKGMGSTSYSTSIKDTDGFLTAHKNLLLTMCYADCVPLYFLDRKNGLMGVAHAGWKGTVDEIGPAMLTKFQGEGSSISDIDVVIGPSICKDCYVVDDRVMKRVKKVLEDGNDMPYNLKEEGQYHLDLKKVNKLLLLQRGLNDRQIHTSGYCSSCSSEFFSYRRDEGKTGRMMSFIGWKEK